MACWTTWHFNWEKNPASTGLLTYISGPLVRIIYLIIVFNKSFKGSRNFGLESMHYYDPYNKIKTNFRNSQT